MSAPEFDDRTGVMRKPEDFHHALLVVMQRLVKSVPGQPGFDIELHMEFTTIIEALKIAERVAVGAYKRSDRPEAPV
jgi:hypothetical protein